VLSPGPIHDHRGLEGQPAGNLFFAGEHTNSFHEWQGFMEGAVLSGIDAAAGILRHRRLLARR
jgi:monoamine oxidase